MKRLWRPDNWTKMQVEKKTHAISFARGKLTKLQKSVFEDKSVLSDLDYGEVLDAVNTLWEVLEFDKLTQDHANIHEDVKRKVKDRYG